MISRVNPKNVAICAVIAVFFFSVFFSVAHMEMDMSGQMTGCPAMQGVAICNMTPLQHIAAAQIMLTALPQSSDLLSLMLLLILGLLIARHNYRSRAAFSQVPAPRQSRVGTPVVISALQLAFARGILNPKLF